jgi:hypothetical protein
MRAIELLVAVGIGKKVLKGQRDSIMESSNNRPSNEVCSTPSQMLDMPISNLDPLDEIDDDGEVLKK